MYIKYQSIVWYAGMKDEDMSLTIKCLDKMLHKRKQVCCNILAIYYSYS